MTIGDDETYTLRRGKAYAHLFFDCGTWEYMDDEDDSNTYVCGTYLLDDDSATVVDYDGVYVLPLLVKDLLEKFYKLDL